MVQVAVVVVASPLFQALDARLVLTITEVSTAKNANIFLVNKNGRLTFASWQLMVQWRPVWGWGLFQEGATVRSHQFLHCAAL